MTGTRRRIVRLVLAVVFTLPVVLSFSLTSLAAPSAEEVRAAKDRLAALGHDFEEIAEQYNHAKYRLSLTEANLAEANEQRREAESEAEAAESQLADRAEYLAALEAQRLALQQAQQEAASSVTTPAPTGDGGGFVPPVNGSAASIAVRAAYDVVGT